MNKFLVLDADVPRLVQHADTPKAQLQALRFPISDDNYFRTSWPCMR